MRVLIVEDDASARRGLTELVRAWGHEAEGAADGQEGLDRITTYRPSAVLADMVMPRMDGLELLRRVKEQLEELTFVLITAQGSVDTAVSAMKEGAYDYLTKPVDPQRLRTLLSHVAERKNALRDVASLRRQLLDHGDVCPPRITGRARLWVDATGPVRLTVHVRSAVHVRSVAPRAEQDEREQRLHTRVAQETRGCASLA